MAERDADVLNARTALGINTGDKESINELSHRLQDVEKQITRSLDKILNTQNRNTL